MRAAALAIVGALALAVLAACDGGESMDEALVAEDMRKYHMAKASFTLAIQDGALAHEEARVYLAASQRVLENLRAAEQRESGPTDCVTDNLFPALETEQKVIAHWLEGEYDEALEQERIQLQHWHNWLICYNQ